MRRKGVSYPCPFNKCEAVFKRPDRLRYHVNLHNGERSFTCRFEGCNKSYSTSSHLIRHEDTHIAGIRCTEEGCNVLMKTKSSLQKHLDCVHHKKHKKYKCNYCSSEFNKHNWLRSHIAKEHTFENPFPCPVENCNKRFLYPSKLKLHMKVHKGYTCSKPGCGKKFSQWTLYVKHFKHFHPVVHKCRICDKEFSGSNNRDAHEQVHKEEREIFMCEKPDCSKYYIHKRNLDFHVRSYHDERPFVCSQEKCFKAFKTKEELEHHLTIHDPTKPLRKKKKKKKKKLSFAARLAGFARPKPSKKQESERTSKSSDEEKESTSKDEGMCDASTLIVNDDAHNKSDDDISAMQIMENILSCCA